MLHIINESRLDDIELQIVYEKDRVSVRYLDEDEGGVICFASDRDEALEYVESRGGHIDY